MRTARVLGAALLLGAGAALCGGQEVNQVAELEAVFKEMIAQVNRITEALRSVKDEETAEAARPILKKSAAGLKEVEKRSAALQKIPKVERDRVSRKYGDEVRSAVTRLTREVARVRDVPGGRDALEELTTPPAKLEKEKEKEKDKEKEP
jgi:hypothetical protein